MMHLVRLGRLILLVLLVIEGILLAGGHGLLCRVRLSTPEKVHGIARHWHRTLLRILNVRVHLDNRTEAERGLIAANHLSWLDIPVLGSVLPTYFLAKAEVRDMFVIGWLAERGGTVFFRRGRHQLDEVRALMESRLTHGHFLTFFPEATTGPGDRLRPFHPRLFSAAIDSGTPVVPVAILYRGGDPTHSDIPFRDESFFANVWRVLGLRGVDVDVIVRPAIESAGQTRRELSEQARGAVARALNLPLEPAPPGFPEKAPENRS